MEANSNDAISGEYEEQKETNVNLKQNHHYNYSTFSFDVNIQKFLKLGNAEKGLVLSIFHN